jgi:predicted DNA-binding protein with PD1-like motif
VKVEKGEEVIDKLTRGAAAFNIENGAITLIGAVQECTISVMAKNDALKDHLRTYDQPFELNGTGEVVHGKVHVHVTLGGEDVTVAGHLHSATVRDFFVRAYITSLGN